MYKKKLLFTTRIPNLDNDNNSGNGGDSGYQSIEYYIIENVEHVCENNANYRYGISIIRRNNIGEIEESLVKSVSDSKSDVEELISCLCIHTVTPHSLYDILEDFSVK